MIEFFVVEATREGVGKLAVGAEAGEARAADAAAATDQVLVRLATVFARVADTKNPMWPGSAVLTVPVLNAAQR